MNNAVEFQAVFGDCGSPAISIENPVRASRVSDLNRSGTALSIVVLIVAMMLSIFSISYAVHEFKHYKPYHRLTRLDGSKRNVNAPIPITALKQRDLNG